MKIVVVGVSHHRVPLTVLERVSKARDLLSEDLRQLQPGITEGFVLATCHRVELYAVGADAARVERALRGVLGARAGSESVRVQDAAYAYEGDAAVRHALRVAAGLDSMMPGEGEIQGQVRLALNQARDAGMIGTELDRLGSAALACGRRVRAGTELGRSAGSLASLALRMVVHGHDAIVGARVVLVGAGELAARVLDALESHAPARITIVNRRLERARHLAAARGAVARPWSELADAIRDADLVIGCTASAEPVIDTTLVSTAIDTMAGRSLTCLDLGVPRDFDVAVGRLPGVVLIDVDALRPEAARTSQALERDIAAAERIVDHEVDRHLDWWRGRAVAATIVRLRRHATTIGERELERALARLPELSPRERGVLDELVTRLIGKLLHEPTTALKQDPDGADVARVVERLFALGESTHASDSSDVRHPSAAQDNLTEEIAA